MHKLEHLVNGEWVAHSYPATFEVNTRLIAAVPGGDSGVFKALIECLEPPLFLLYVLHTPRGEAEPGRYQSPLLSKSEIEQFLERFGCYLSADARFDLWAHSPSDNATVVWDRHNRIFGYGLLEQLSLKLKGMGFYTSLPRVPDPHVHQYRSEFDVDARQLLAAFTWSHSPLRTQDEQ